MIASCFFWALGTVLTKDSIGDAPGSFRVYVFNGLRLVIATVVLFIYMFLRGESPVIRREHIVRMALVSLFGFHLFMVVFHLGLTMTTASHAGILIGTIPLFIVIVSTVTGVERPNRWLILGILTGFTGVAALTAHNGIFGINPGDLLVIVSCMSWAFYTVYGKTVLEIYSPIVTTAWVFLFTTIFHIPLFLMQVSGQSWSAIPVHSWVNMVIAAIGALFLSNTLYYYALDVIGPSRVGIYTNLEPGFTLLLAWGIGSETITTIHIVGFIAIMTGIVLTKRGEYPDNQ